MSVSMWSYRPEVCDGGGCPGDCDLCDKPKNMEDEDDATDYIKRDAVIDYLDSNNMPWRDWVKDIPSADVRENIKAHWKNVNDEYYSCSYCGGCADIAYHYCPWCGADMRGEV